jgi:hypothetical protein
VATRTISYGCSGLGLGDTVTCTGAVTENNETIAALASDFQVNLAIDVSALKGLYIVATAAMTLETNDGTTPDDTITLVANQPLVWTSVSLLTNPLGTDVTEIFVTSTAGGTLSYVVVQDATP